MEKEKSAPAVSKRSDRQVVKRIVLLCLTVLIAMPLAAAQTGQSKTAEAVLGLEREWREALLKADLSKLETLYDDNLVYTHSSGVVDDKAKYIASLRTGALKYESIEFSEQKANVYNDTAVVTSRVAFKVINQGTPGTFNVRMIHVYVRDGGRWRMVAHQTTRLAS
jgi:hypothetical protein